MNTDIHAYIVCFDTTRFRRRYQHRCNVLRCGVEEAFEANKNMFPIICILATRNQQH